MKIVVTVKTVPDTTAPKALDPQTFRLVRTAGVVLNPFDEFALEAALRLREANAGSTVTVLCMGPEIAREPIRKALGMGADAAVHICDPSLIGADARATSIVLTAALQRLQADLVLCGSVAADSSGGYMPRLLAARLQMPFINLARSVEVRNDRIVLERTVSGGREEFRIALPAVISVSREIGAVRYPSLKGIMAAKSKPLDRLTLAELGVDPSMLIAPWQLTQADPRPPRAAARIVEPASAQEAASAIIAFLRERKVR